MIFEHAIDFETDHTVDQLSHWMRNYCVGQWDVFTNRLEETPAGELRKHLQVLFEKEQDKGLFRRHFEIS